LLVDVEVPVLVDACAPGPPPEWLPLGLLADAEDDVLVDACAPDPVPDWLPLLDDEVDGLVQAPPLAWLLVELPLD
jgi:hypothetical protein